MAYTAGIIDGEGSIGIQRNRKNSNSYSLRIRVTNTDPWVCYWLKNTFGGSVSIETTDRNRPCYKWTIACRKAGIFLAMILPYLHIKKPQAEIASKFQTTKRLNRARVPCETAYQEAQKILLEKMNHGIVR